MGWYRGRVKYFFAIGMALILVMSVISNAVGKLNKPVGSNIQTEKNLTKESSEMKAIEKESPMGNKKISNTNGSDNEDKKSGQMISERRERWADRMITIAGFIIGALIIVWQISRQHRNSLALQKENFREELKLNIYKELGDKIEDAGLSFNNAGMYVFMIPMSIKDLKWQSSQGLQPKPIDKRAKEFIDLHSNAKQSLIELFRLFEKYQIVNPNFRIFQIALSAASFDVDETFPKLTTELLKYLPIEPDPDSVSNVDKKVIVLPMPNDDQLKKLEELITTYWEGTTDVVSYLMDLNVEAQNLLLGKLFENKVSPRRPLDSKRIVISTESERIKELESYFEKDTAWGRDRQRTLSRAQQNISDKASSI